MTTVPTGFTFPQAQGANALRAPGLRFAGAQTQRPAASRPAHGVPLFVGFGKRLPAVPLSAPPVLELSGWEHFRSWVDPLESGFLSSAVKGFFANGGKFCAVLPVLSAGPKPEAQDLMRPFAGGGILEDVGDIDLVCVPDAVARFINAGSALQDIQATVLEHCQTMGDRFAILDAGRFDGDCLAQVTDQSHWNKTHFGALYFPWLRLDSTKRGEAANRIVVPPVPPCGHVAGLYARTDARTGVHKAPANEIVEGAVAVDWNLDDEQHGQLNDAGVNCIRSSPGRGIRVWGARTLSGQSGWLYVPVTRLFLALTAWLKNHMDDIVFESHTPELRRRVQRRLAAYCLELMDSGALAGMDPASAFFVKCDAENNPPASRDAGQLVAEVGLAPAIPAEFVVVRITQDANGIAVTGL